MKRREIGHEREKEFHKIDSAEESKRKFLSFVPVPARVPGFFYKVLPETQSES